MYACALCFNSSSAVKASRDDAAVQPDTEAIRLAKVINLFRLVSRNIKKKVESWIDPHCPWVGPDEKKPRRTKTLRLTLQMLLEDVDEQNLGAASSAGRSRMAPNVPLKTRKIVDAAMEQQLELKRAHYSPNNIRCCFDFKLASAEGVNKKICAEIFRSAMDSMWPDDHNKLEIPMAKDAFAEKVTHVIETCFGAVHKRYNDKVHKSPAIRTASEIKKIIASRKVRVSDRVRG